ncbi:MAG: AsmA family protein, partial [Pseudomonadota bacterium]
AVALTLVAALVVPFFVDWGTFRGTVENRASAALGVPVTIDGDLSIRLLPSPVVDARSIKIGESGFQAERIQMRVGLTPLIQGDVQIDQLTITAPRIHIAVSNDGALSYNPIAGLGIDAERVSLAALEIRRGVVIVDQPGGEFPILLGLPVLTGGFESLRGPFRFDGALDRRGQTYDLTLNTGRWNRGGSQPENAGGQMRAQLVLAARGRPVAADFDGLVMATRDNRLSFLGQSRFERIVADGEDALPFIIRTETRADGNGAEFSDMVAELGDPAARVALEGRGTVRFGLTPGIDLDLGAQQADFDRLIDSLSTGPNDDRSLFGLLGKLASVALPFPGRVETTIGRAIIGGNIVENVRARFGYSGPLIENAGEATETEQPGRWRAEEIRALLPGESAVRLSGDVDAQSGAEGEGRLVGSFAIDSQRPRVLADWLFPGERARNAWITGALSAEGAITMGRDALDITDIAATLDESRVTGSISSRADAPAEVALQADQLQLGALRALADRLGQANQPRRALDSGQGLLAGRGLKLNLGVDRILSENFIAGGMRVRAGIVDGRLELEEASVDDLAGAQISARSGDEDGALALEVRADRVDGLAELLRVFGQEPLADRMAAAPALFAPLDLTGGLTPDSDEDARYKVETSGRIGPTQVSINGTLGSDIARWRDVPLDIELEAAAPRAVTMLRQAGLADGAIPELPVDGDEQATLSLVLNGTPKQRIETDLSAGQGEATFQLKGGIWFPGAGSDGAGLDLVAEVDSLPPALVQVVLGDWASGLEQPVSAAGRIDGLPPYALRALQADISGNQISGDGIFDPRAGGAARLSLTLDADRLSLAWLGERAFGQQASEFARALAGRAAYPEGVVDWRLADGLEVRATVSANQLDVMDDVSLRDAAITAELESDAVRISEFSGEAFGGSVSGAVDLGLVDGETTLSGRLSLEDAQLADFVWERGGRPVGEGGFSLSASFESAARSYEGLVAQSSGGGAITLADASLRGITSVALDRIVAAADEGMELDEAAITPVLAAYLDQGSSEIATIELPFSIAGGVVRVNRLSIDAAPLTFLASGTADLTARTLQSNWTVRASPDEDAPEKVREFGMSFDGPFRAPQRQIDAQPLIGYLTIRAFEREVERIERQQAALHERGRMDRELIHFRRQVAEEARRQREEEEAERARQRAAREAARQAEIRAREAARQAEIRAREDAERAEQERLRAAQEAARLQQLQLQQAAPPPLPQPQNVGPPPGAVSAPPPAPARSPFELQGVDPAGG